ncbi:MAG: NERD domain-containing protein [Pseudazoarcus pumilus]|nr:NERD domain-containing protein [Pseudazoarcus pumilus]
MNLPLGEILAPVYTAALVLFVLSLIIAIFRLPVVKGWFGETQGALAKHLLLDKDIYTTLNNVTIPTSNGTTQIDHIVVSRHGIFVIETKNMKGWIFGDEKSAQWTQNVFGRRYRFQNPLHQNYRHIRALADFLQLPDERFHSVVMFWGNAELKTPLPDNVLTRGYTSYLKSKQAVLFSDEEVAAIIDAVQSGQLPRTLATHREHVASLKARHESTTTCPRCGNALTLRTAKSGANAGKQFYGCSTFPACRYMRGA